MAERPKPTPTIDSITSALMQLTEANYAQEIANPLWQKYVELEFGPDDPEIQFGLVTLIGNPSYISDINYEHIHRVPMEIMLLGAHIVEEDIKPGRLTDEKLTERSRTAYWLLSQLSWLEISRRKYMGAINAAALFRANDEVFKEKFGQVFEERPLEEKVKMFNDGYVQAWNRIYQHGFTVIGGEQASGS